MSPTLSVETLYHSQGHQEAMLMRLTLGGWKEVPSWGLQGRRPGEDQALVGERLKDGKTPETEKGKRDHKLKLEGRTRWL